MNRPTIDFRGVDAPTPDPDNFAAPDPMELLAAKEWLVKRRLAELARDADDVVEEAP
jgi:hypothetical protein